MGNARLRRYIDESIRRPCQSNAAKFQAQFGNPAPLSSSKERLGFIGPYTKVDLARNSIPAGDFLKNAGVDGFSNAGGLPVGGVTLKQFV